MAKSISVHEKKRGRGRPATGVDPAVTTRLPVDVLAKLEKWAAANGYHRSQAIAHLVERGLAAESPPERLSKGPRNPRNKSAKKGQRNGDH
jgi:CopG-like RHH_1 or ribbon-helix-helix domain, RHH_5